MTSLAQARLVEPRGAGRYAVPCGGSCGGERGAHVVTIGPDAAACDCPAGVFGRHCRHVSAVTAYLQLAPLETTTGAGPGLERDVPPPDGPQ